MTQRMTREERWSYLELVLTNATTAVKGEMACLDTSTGALTPGAGSTTLLPVGYFEQDLIGDGTLTVRVRMFREMVGHWFANDAGAPVLSSDIGSEVYILDSKTVTKTSASKSKAGRVWSVSTRYGVLIEGGIGVTGPTGGSGSALASGGAATRAAMTAIAAASRFDGELMVVRSDGSLWRFVAASTQTVDGAGELVLAPDAGTGRWVRAQSSFTLRLPIGYALADAAALLTVPEQMCLRQTAPAYYEITTGFTGGSSSAIGMSASAIATTKGDLLGGATGDVTATLGTAGIKAGTIGPLVDTPAEVQAFFLKAADVLRFNRVTSVFTAGAGFIHYPVAIQTVA